MATPLLDSGWPVARMNPTEAIRIALLSLWANKLRSALTLLGVVIGVAAVMDLNLVAGRMLNDNDLERGAAVAIIGQDIVEKLLPGIDPINKEIRVDGKPYLVIGVGEKEGKTLGQSRDNYVIIPVTTWL